MTPATRTEQAAAPDFLGEINMLLGMFHAALDMDDWDLAQVAFLALSQNAWNAHVLLTGDPRWRCPALPVEPVCNYGLPERD